MADWPAWTSPRRSSSGSRSPAGSTPPVTACRRARPGTRCRRRWTTGGSAAPPGRAGTQPTHRARESFARLVGVDAADVAVGAQVSQLLAPVAAAIPDGARCWRPTSSSPRSSSRGWPRRPRRHGEHGAGRRAGRADRPGHRRGRVQPGPVGHRRGRRLRRRSSPRPARSARWSWSTPPRPAAGCRSTPAWPTWSSLGGYKWLMSPRGTALAYLAPGGAGADAADRGRLVRRRGRARLVLRAADGAGRATPAGSTSRRPGSAGSAPRPRWSWSSRSAWTPIHDHNVALANRFLAGLGQPPGDSAIVTVDVPGAQERLARRRGPGRRAGRPGPGLVPRLLDRARRGPGPRRADRLMPARPAAGGGRWVDVDAGPAARLAERVRRPARRLPRRPTSTTRCVHRGRRTARGRAVAAAGRARCTPTVEEFVDEALRPSGGSGCCWPARPRSRSASPTGRTLVDVQGGHVLRAGPHRGRRLVPAALRPAPGEPGQGGRRRARPTSRSGCCCRPWPVVHCGHRRRPPHGRGDPGRPPARAGRRAAGGPVPRRPGAPPGRPARGRRRGPRGPRCSSE